jgi:hypothetical protein
LARARSAEAGAETSTAAAVRAAVTMYFMAFLLGKKADVRNLRASIAILLKPVVFVQL